MERRKFIAGVGSLAAGTAAAMGTGAFNTVIADRTVSVDVAGDASAFLSLLPSDSEEAVSQNNNGAYASQTGDTLEIQLDENADVGGDGLNDNAETRFWDVFEISNQGANDVFVWIEEESIPDGMSFIAVSPPAVDSGDAPRGTSLGSSQPGKLWDQPPVPHPARNFIPVGGSMDQVSINVDTSVLEEGDHTITIRAERKDSFSDPWDTYELTDSE